jgi:putative methionine-R-sulfoxide reductase with GAF domain
MIEHIVMWKLHEQAEGRSADENFSLTKEQLTSLVNVIPVIRRLDVYRNINPDAKNMDMTLVSSFDSLEDLAFYAGHPEHLKVGAFIGKVAFDRSAIDYMN